jgi:phosphate transport system protein
MMSRPLDIGINQIKTLLMKMGKLAMDSTHVALEGFHKEEDTYAQNRMWSNTIQMLAEEVEDQATELIALHQPMASDLRILKAYIKISYDLERYGRYAMDISDIMHQIGEWSEIEGPELTVNKLGETTLQVMELSLEMIDTMDETKIFELSKIETATDDLYFENLRRLSDCKGDPKAIVANLLTIRYLERLADHGSYIAESISYAATGKRISIR